MQKLWQYNFLGIFHGRVSKHVEWWIQWGVFFPSVTLTILKHGGTIPVISEQLKTCVISGSRGWEHCFRNHVGIGSNGQLLLGDFRITSLTSHFSVTSLQTVKEQLGPSATCTSSESSPIYLTKKSLKIVTSSWGSLQGGNTSAFCFPKRSETTVNIFLWFVQFSRTSCWKLSAWPCLTHHGSTRHFA